jgi:iron-sulfur cluster assembly accessory protein
MIHLSQAAIREVIRLKSKQPSQNALFRLGVTPGGCSGLSYTIAFDSHVTEQDQVQECDGIQVVVDSQSLKSIGNLSIDYSEDLMGGGFRFHNPQASTHCSCGHSFSVADAG